METGNRTKIRIEADLMMLLAAIIWGGGFVAQRIATRYIGPFTFNGIRFALAGILLLPIVLRSLKRLDKKLLWIFPAGILLFGGSALQQIGLATTTAGSAGFITGVYVVLVPVFLSLLWRNKIPAVNWIAAIIALGGTYLLSTGGELIRPGAGDLFELVGAVVWAFHVIVVGLAVRELDSFVFSVGQFLVCGLINLIVGQFVSPLSWTAVQPAIPALLYAGVFSVAIGFTLQAIGQSRAPTTDAVLILSLESVFGAIFGALFLAERMNWVQILGAAIILTTIIGAQIISTKRAGELKSETELDVQ
jgi:drug/metabolite transporter (DMT)-like permease